MNTFSLILAIPLLSLCLGAGEIILHILRERIGLMQTYNELLLHPAKGVEDYCRNSGASPPDRSFACMTEVEWRRGDGEWYSVCEEGVKKQFTPRHYRIRLNCPANPSHDNKSLLSEELRLLR